MVDGSSGSAVIAARPTRPRHNRSRPVVEYRHRSRDAHSRQADRVQVARVNRWLGLAIAISITDDRAAMDARLVSLGWLRLRRLRNVAVVTASAWAVKRIESRRV